MQKLLNDDCLNVTKKISNDSIDLVYLDPPFFTQKKQTLTSSDGTKYEFNDTWDSRQSYVSYIRQRLLELHRVLKSTGNLFLHCDVSASHYLRCLLDEVFGEAQFRGEIIWSYKRWSNSKKGLLPAHQTIFHYSKSSMFKFNTIYCSYSPTTNIDQILQERIRSNETGKAVYKRDTDGNTIVAREKRGVPMSDVWEIPFLNPKAKERTGYPTQKPIELLDRIIKISTDPGDIVLDPFCGSGTTIISATLLNRDSIGIDLNPAAIRLTQSRLENPQKTESQLLLLGKEAYQTKNSEILTILGQLDCDIVQRNKGIDAFLRAHLCNAPVAIRIQRVGESVLDAIELLDSAGKKKMCSYTILFYRDYDNFAQIVPPPANMIMIPLYSTQINSILSDKQSG